MPAISTFTASSSLSGTQVVIVGGGPVGLACALELELHGVSCIVLERRPEVSMLRPRAKTTSTRTMEHLRRWGLADELRSRAPLKPSWSKDIVFCTTVLGREVSRITNCLGLELEGSDLVSECGQQVPQPIVEQLFREAIGDSELATLVTGVTVTRVTEREDDVEVELEDSSGAGFSVRAPYVLGCDGGASLTRDAIGATLEGGPGALPNLNFVFRAPQLRDRIPFGRALHYWVLNPKQPGLIGWLDLDGTFWGGGLGVDAATTAQTPEEIIHNLLGEPLEVEVLSTDAWQARMLLADSYGSQRVFLVGDAAHQNPPWGGHGFNTGVGDAVNIGWKLGAVINGWAPASLLQSYGIERRPIEERTIALAVRNMAVLSTELSDPRLFGDDDEFDEVVEAVAKVIQETKPAEFHSLGLTLGYEYEGSPIVATEPGGDAGRDDLYLPTARPGHRLPHFWLAPGDSIFDRLGGGMNLVGNLSTPLAAAFQRAAEQLGVPMTLVDLGSGGRRDLYEAGLVLVRPDQHVAWRGDGAADPSSVIQMAIGSPGFEHTDWR
jgi:2-polyprenyl-6-methoxyphenol hydroxylase-like FAD-dependent oxidoreductase